MAQGLHGRIVGDQGQATVSRWPKPDHRLGHDMVRPPRLRAPGPGIAEPEMWQKVQRGGLRPSIERLDADTQVFGR